MDKFPEGDPLALSLKTNQDGKDHGEEHPKAFNPERLVQELLSLGHPRITPEVAKAITQEVSATLKDHPDREITAPWVSQVVEERLLNRGILEHPGQEAGPVEEETRSNRTQGLLQNGQKTALPTLEKFLKNSQPPPPRARVQVQGHQPPMASDPWEEHFWQVAQRAAEAESRFPAPQDVPTLAVEFFNAMANQEFYPHHTGLLPCAENTMAFGGRQVWMDLPLGPDSAEAILKEAKKVWEQKGLVSFVIPGPEGDAGFSDGDFEEFLQGVERSLLELPEGTPLPATVGLYLDMDQAEALRWARLALSGKYYPKFSICLGMAALNPPPEGLEELRRLGPLLLHPKTATGSGAPLFPRWGGGPDLETWELCQLGSVNLAIVANGSDVDWGKLRRVVRTAVHFLENLVETESYPLETVAQHSKANRKIGLGVMGYAELLIKLGIPYQSETALTMAEKIMRFMGQEAITCSHQLAKARRVFPNFSKSHWKTAGRKIRHRALLAVCPAPELARMAGVTPGWGPLESILQWEETEEEAQLKALGLFQKIATRQKLWSPALHDALLSAEGGGMGSSQGLPPGLRDLFTTRKEMPPLWLCQMQGAFERHCEGAAGLCYQLGAVGNEFSLQDFIQKAGSLNLHQLFLAQDLRPRLLVLPDAAPPEQPAMPIEGEIEEPEAEVESAGEEVTEIEDAPFPPPQPRPLPDLLQAQSRRVETLHGTMKVTVGYDAQGPYEFSAQVGKSGSEAAAQAEALSRLISLLFSLGVEPQSVIAELKDIRAFSNRPGEALRSIPDGIAHALRLELGREEEDSPAEEEVTEVLEAGTLH